MDDLIKRSDAIKAVWKPQVKPNELIFDALKTAIESEINNVPSADQSHGEWIVLGGTDFNGISYCAKCSNCKAVYDGIRLSNYSYCPNCGSRMSKGADDE